MCDKSKTNHKKMKFKCEKCGYNCILEMQQAPLHEDPKEFAKYCIFDCGLVKWSILKEK